MDGSAAGLIIARPGDARKQNQPGVNRSWPADPRGERNASPLPGSARQPGAGRFRRPTVARYFFRLVCVMPDTSHNFIVADEAAQTANNLPSADSDILSTS